MAQAAFAPEPAPQQSEPSFDVLRWHDEPWTAQLALDLLPETNGPKVEVLSGSVIVTPHAGYDHQDAELDLAYLLKQAARHAKLWLVSPGNRHKDVIDRPRQYAAVGVPYFLRVDLRNRVPTIALFELAEGEYRPLAAAAAGTPFVMKQPFEFSIDPADLLGEEAPTGEPDRGE